MRGDRLREVLAIISILGLLFPIFFIPDTRVLDSRIVDAALAETSAWMESEIALPRYLSFIRCLIDGWLADNFGKDVDDVELPSTMNTEVWRNYTEKEAEGRGIKLHLNVTPVRLSKSLSANELQNKAFAGKCKLGAIGVRGFIFIKIVSSRGFAKGIAKKSYSISVCHPCLYFLIEEAHEEVEKGLEELFTRKVIVGPEKDFVSAISLLESSFSDFDEEISEFFDSKKVEYLSKGIDIEFHIKRDVYISKKGKTVDLTAKYEFYVEIWDKEVLYWDGNLRKGWYLKNDLEFQIRMICMLLDMPEKAPTDEEREPVITEDSSDRRMTWPVMPR